MGCETDYAWAAGFLDGEGYFCLQPVHKRGSDGWRNRKPRLEAAQTDIKPLLRLQSLFGGSVIKTVRREGRKQAYRWDLTGIAIKPTLLHILPYLTVKRDQTLVLLEFIGLMLAHKNKGSTGKLRISDDEKQLREALYERLCNLRKGD